MMVVASKEWFFDGKPVRVGHGSYKAHCDSARIFCAGGTKYGPRLSFLSVHAISVL